MNKTNIIAMIIAHPRDLLVMINFKGMIYFNINGSFKNTGLPVG